MSLSEVGIYNLALRHLGHSTEVQDRDEDTEPAAACRRFYEQALHEALRDFPWPFATKVAALALAGTDPVPGYGYSYTMPTDCMFFRRILSGRWNDSRSTRVPSTIIYGATGELICCNLSEATAEYTVRVTDPTRFPADFAQGVALLLAAYIAPSVTGGDPAKLGVQALQKYMLRMSKAQANAANEEQAEQSPVSSFEEAR